MPKFANSKTISEAFLQQVKHNGQQVAFRHKKDGAWTSVTFAQHFESVRRLACGLHHLGVKKGDRVNILAQTSLAWSQFDLAILGVGGITVPIYPTSTPEDTKYIINHAETAVLFVDDFKNLQKLAAVASECPKLKLVVVNFEHRSSDLKAPFEIMTWNALYDLGLNKEGALGPKVDACYADSKGEDVFTICYTSGTTGLPKGVVLTHSAMQSVMIDVDKVLGSVTRDDEVMLSFLPMSHIFGKLESMLPYYMGWTSAFAESLDTLVTNLPEVKPTLLIAVPRIFEKVYNRILAQVAEGSAVKQQLFAWAMGVGREVMEARNAGKSASFVTLAQYEIAKKLVFSKVVARFGGNLRLCVSGSAPLARNIQEFMHIVGVPVYEGYGLTETCAPVAVNIPGANRFGSVGKVLPEVLVRIAEDGEILIKSAKNFREYYKNPEATKESIKDGWFHTGDIGHIDDDGFLLITDRKKDLIKTAGGKYLAPQKIENLAKSQPVLSQVVIYGDQKPFAVALLTLNQEYVMQYAKSHKILSSQFSELVKQTEIQKLVQKAIDDINSQLARYETIKSYIIVPREFSVEEGDLTPSLKIKRKQICQKYKAELEALYKDAKD